MAELDRMMPIFTMTELEEYSVAQLRLLAKFFDVELKINDSKGRMIEKIYRKLEALDRENNVSAGSPASVRVQRIRDSVKEK